MVNQPPETPFDTRLEQAVDWHVRLQGDADQGLWLEFTEWLEADPSHREAYEEVECLWRQVDKMPRTQSPGSIIDISSQRRPVPAPANLSRRWFLGVGAAAAAAAALVVTPPRYDGSPAGLEIFETAPGQRQTAKLADGSSIILNSGTRLTVSLSGDFRTVVLEKGEALFDVAKDPTRPFTVAAGERLVTVVGTAFNVRNLDQAVTVTVTRGLVDVGNGDGGGKVRLTPGQQISARQGQAPSAITTVDAQAVTSWTEGRLSFDNMPLPQVLAELSRHYPVPMHVEGTAADLHFSGVLRLERDQASVLGTLQGLLPIAVTRQGDSFVLSKRH